jgi:hypothetical protein
MSLNNLRTNQSDIDVVFIIVWMTKLLGSHLWSKLNSMQVASASQEVRVVGVSTASRLYTIHSPVGPHDPRRWPPLSLSGNINLLRSIMLILLVISWNGEV